MTVGFIFPADPLNFSQPDLDYQAEYQQLQNDGYQVIRFSFEDLLEQKLRLSAPIAVKELIYRGWMLQPQTYQFFEAALKQCGYQLATSSQQYQNAHLLPNWYNSLAQYTVKSVYSADLTQASLTKLLQAVGPQAIVKDYVKSRKYEWATACYIPDTSDIAASLAVINNFIARQGDSLTSGIVLRQFVDLKKIGRHPHSELTESEEFRVFYYHQVPFIEFVYWENQTTGQISQAEQQLVRDMGQLVSANFFTIDFARRSDGQLIVMEVGDGQVSGLQGLSPATFYQHFEKVL